MKAEKKILNDTLFISNYTVQWTLILKSSQHDFIDTLKWFGFLYANFILTAILLHVYISIYFISSFFFIYYFL